MVLKLGDEFIIIIEYPNTANGILYIKYFANHLSLLPLNVASFSPVKSAITDGKANIIVYKNHPIFSVDVKKLRGTKIPGIKRI